MEIHHGQVVPESKLAALAKQARIDAGITQTEAAQRLGVSRPTVVQAENEPTRPLSALRRKMILEFSGGYRCVGPYWILARRGDTIKDRDIFL